MKDLRALTYQYNGSSSERNVKMKVMKRIAGLVLSIVLVLSMIVPVMAASSTITVNNAVVGQTYKLYKIFDVAAHNALTNAYIYKLNSNWSNFTAPTYFTTDGLGQIIWLKDLNNDKVNAEFAKAALAYAETNGIQPINTVNCTTTLHPVVFDVTTEGLGHFLLNTSMGTVLSMTLHNIGTGVTVNDKNLLPTIDKEVQEDSTNGWGDTNDAQIGDTIYYKSTISVNDIKGDESVSTTSPMPLALFSIPTSEVSYIFHDSMDDGLTFKPNSVLITLTENGSSVTLVSPAEFAVIENPADSCQCTFHVVFNKAYVESLTKDHKIIITYQATLNKNAVVTGNCNHAVLEYGNKNYTTVDQTTTYTWDVDIFKYADATRTPLSGAEFILSYNDGQVRKYATFDTTTVSGKAIVVDWNATEATATRLTSDEDGKINIHGLDSDSIIYYLKETKSPAGYSLPANEIAFKVKTVKDASGEYTGVYQIVDNSTPEMLLNSQNLPKQIDVENTAGIPLPSTGGIGTTIFYTLGGLMVFAAVVLLVTKKRMSESR